MSIDYSRIITAEARAEAEARIAEQALARAYLAETDWYVTRKLETGAAVPRDVTERRQAARAVL